MFPAAAFQSLSFCPSVWSCKMGKWRDRLASLLALSLLLMPLCSLLPEFYFGGHWGRFHLSLSVTPPQLYSTFILFIEEALLNV